MKGGYNKLFLVLLYKYNIMREIKTNDAPKAIGPYSQAVEINGFLFASGQLPANPETGNIEGDIVKQAEQSCKNVEAILKANGMDFSNVVKTTCFLANIEDFAKFNEVYSKYFTGEIKPARSCVAVKDIPKGALCEIEIIASK